MLIWCFVPYCLDGSRLASESYDTAATKAELAHAFRDLGRAWIWQPITHSNLCEVLAQVRATATALVFNFCDGIDTDGRPGVSVVRALEGSGLPFTGADARFYDISTSKLAMKRLFEAASVPTSRYAEIPGEGAVDGICGRLGSPLLVKPDVSAASCGITLRSKVWTDEAIGQRRDELRQQGWNSNGRSSGLFVERFIQGPEFTVFLIGDARRPDRLRYLPVAERAFHDSIPESERFLSYDRYWGYYREETPPAGGAKFYYYKLAEEPLASRVAAVARDAYCAVHGIGYARVDIRMDQETGDFYVLEVNANPGISSDHESSVGSILQAADIPFSSLIHMIVGEALVREAVRQECA